jgi:hypothetical protein
MNLLKSTRTPRHRSRIGYAIMQKSRFLNFVQLRQVFPHADQVDCSS